MSSYSILRLSIRFHSVPLFIISKIPTSFPILESLFPWFVQILMIATLNPVRMVVLARMELIRSHVPVKRATRVMIAQWVSVTICFQYNVVLYLKKKHFISFSTYIYSSPWLLSLIVLLVSSFLLFSEHSVILEEKLTWNVNNFSITPTKKGSHVS